MTRILLSMGIACLFAGIVAAQSNDQVAFPESIPMPTTDSEVVVVPQSPLSLQVLFVGGHDLVTVNSTYGNPVGRAIAKEWHDFIGFTPDDSQGGLGWISVNHEMIYRDDYIGDGGGNTMFYVARQGDSLEVIETTIPATAVVWTELGETLDTVETTRTGKYHAVDFVNTVGETGMNCGGITDPYTGRIWTAEEWFRRSNAESSSIWNSSEPNRPGSDAPIRATGSPNANQGVRDTSDVTIAQFDLANEWGDILGSEPLRKFQTFNYMVEINPFEAKAIRKQVNWFRQGWEGGTVAADGTVYLGPDATPGYWGKFVPADNSDRDNIDYTQGTYFIYKADKPASSEGGKWVEVPQNRDNVLDFQSAAESLGGTQYNRIEWVAIDTTTGYIYWTETGFDQPNNAFRASSERGSTHDEYHLRRAEQKGWVHPDSLYFNYYGAVWVYNPDLDSNYIWIAGGPETDSATSLEIGAGYPDIHMTNPDGLNVIYINDDQGGVASYLVICEDANGTSHNRTPAGFAGRLNELWLLPISAGQQTTLVNDTFQTNYDELIRISAVPFGAEVTGAQPTSDGATLLVNSQHPSASLEFPWNHSLTYAINGFDKLTVTDLQEIEIPTESLSEFKIWPNPVSRELRFERNVDVAVFNSMGQRIAVQRNTMSLDVSSYATGAYYIMIMTEKGEEFTRKIIVE